MNLQALTTEFNQAKDATAAAIAHRKEIWAELQAGETDRLDFLYQMAKAAVQKAALVELAAAEALWTAVQANQEAQA